MDRDTVDSRCTVFVGYMYNPLIAQMRTPLTAPMGHCQHLRESAIILSIIFSFVAVGDRKFPPVAQQPVSDGEVGLAGVGSVRSFCLSSGRSGEGALFPNLGVFYYSL